MGCNQSAPASTITPAVLAEGERPVGVSALTPADRHWVVTGDADAKSLHKRKLSLSSLLSARPRSSKYALLPAAGGAYSFGDAGVLVGPVSLRGSP